MRKLALFTGIILSLTVVASPGQLITFESLHPGTETSQIEIPDGYAGLNWSDYFLGMTSNYLPGTGYQNGTTGAMTAYTSYHKDVSITAANGTSFDFVGADITAGRLDNILAVIEGWRNGTLVYSQPVTVSTDGPYPFTFNFRNVDTVWFRPTPGDEDYHLAIDNIEVANVATVPEPATLSLFVLGGLVLRRKR